MIFFSLLPVFPGISFAQPKIRLGGYLLLFVSLKSTNPPSSTEPFWRFLFCYFKKYPFLLENGWIQSLPFGPTYTTFNFNSVYIVFKLVSLQLFIRGVLLRFVYRCILSSYSACFLFALLALLAAIGEGVGLDQCFGDLNSQIVLRRFGEFNCLILIIIMLLFFLF